VGHVFPHPVLHARIANEMATVTPYISVKRQFLCFSEELESAQRIFSNEVCFLNFL
jgi:hypothetical protein